MKYEQELTYWHNRFTQEEEKFDNAHYEHRMLRMAEEANDDFMRGKIVADFGCGPRGSLSWTKAPMLRIGIDILATVYLQSFGQCMLEHDMTYITSTERIIPLQSSLVDIMFTLNALDHVDNFECMTKEILRVLKPGGLFVGSLNLNEPATHCEPQTLTEDIIKKNLLRHINISSYRLAKIHPKSPYKFLYENKLSKKKKKDEPYILWVKGTKQ